MASYTLSATEIGIYQEQLAANTVDTITIARSADHVEVWGDGTAAIYFTVDGSTPEVGGKKTYELPPGAPSVREDINVPTGTDTIVKLISAGTPKYSVTAGGIEL